MNFLGWDVRGIDLDGLWQAGRAAYLVGYLGWLALLWRGRRTRGVLAPLLLGLLWWFVVTFPLQRIYGLGPVSDRIRNLWWCSTAAAGNPPWESGVVGRLALEPAWSLLVSLLALRDPAGVIAVYPFLPALAMGAMALGLAWGLRTPNREHSGLSVATLATFFVLLASTGPLDFLEPFRSFWARYFLLKPNHTLGLAMVPVCVRLAAAATTWRRALLAGGALVVMGALFVVDLALFCAALGSYGLLRTVREGRDAWPELRRLALVAAGVCVLVLVPYAMFLAQAMPEAVSLGPPAPVRPARTAHSLVFMAAFDLGLLFPLALLGAWRQWRGRSPHDLLWLGVFLTAHGAWVVSGWWYAGGVPLLSDEIYFFVRFATAVQAAFGAGGLLRGAADALQGLPEAARWSQGRVAALALFCCLPATVPSWWDPVLMDAHFVVALEPMPADMVAVGDYLRRHGGGRDQVLAGETAALWIPALSGRRVVRVSPPPPDSPGRAEERALLLGEDAGGPGQRLGQVRWVVADPSLLQEHGLGAEQLARHPRLKPVYRTGAVTVYAREGS
jgi:hypothetical protein